MKTLKNNYAGTSYIFLATVALVLSCLPVARAQTNGIDALIAINCAEPRHRIPPTLWGIFFEEINHAGDGGLYAEMVRNRSFEEPVGTNGWQFIRTGTATGSIQLDRSYPLSTGSPTSIKLVRNPGGTGQIGILNTGYWGMYITATNSYKLTFYARASEGFTGNVIAQLQQADGSQIFAQRATSGLTTNWQKFELWLQPNSTSTNAALAMLINQPGTVWLDVISLFPEQTFKSRTKGLRNDLATMLLELSPSFVRFPGGCYVEGNYLSNAFNWKNTIGDIVHRKGHLNDVWGYYSSDGLGFHEYLQLCEDLGAEPLFVVNCGMSHNEVVPLEQMQPYIQAALDAIEYANGPTNTYWGALRAANGHPEPFNLKYIQIGNENGGPAYNERYALFYDAIKSRYPEINIIACDWGGIPNSRPVEIRDQHFYSSPGFFISGSTMYDSYDRSAPKVFVGEFAVTSGVGNGNLYGALAEAAFMTGLERNSDVVIMAAYAPLFANVNAKVWNPDLIYFDNHRVAGTPSYYVQKLFSKNRGDIVLPVNVQVLTTITNPLPKGAIGLGSWITAVEYTNIVVTSNNVILYSSDFTQGASEWCVYQGNWIVTNGVYRQTALMADCRATTGDTNWSNYTLSLKARKLYGNEGFLIIFNWRDDNNWTWWNIGGWGNTQHGLENCVKGTKTDLGPRVAGSIQSNRWYDIRIEVTGPRIKCYLDGQLIHDVLYPDTSPKGAIGLGTWATRASFTNILVVKGSDVLYSSDFTKPPSEWRVYRGTWVTTNGTYAQTTLLTDCRTTTGNTNWSDYTLTLKARKESGNEGFLVIFNWQDDNNWMWWNIGGWNNTTHAIEQCVNGVKSVISPRVPGTIQPNRWYDIRIELSGPRIRCFLDGELVHDIVYPQAIALVASSTYEENTGQVILKTVNVTDFPLHTMVSFQGITNLLPIATGWILTGPDPSAENTLQNPTNVVPVPIICSNVSQSFVHCFPANSFTVLRFQCSPTQPVKAQLVPTTNFINLNAVSNKLSIKLNTFLTNTVSISCLIEAPSGFRTNLNIKFHPGEPLEKTFSLPQEVLGPASFARLTITHTEGCTMEGPTKTYLYTYDETAHSLRLYLTQFTDETLLWWTDPAAILISSTNLLGEWTPITTASLPYCIDFLQDQCFYRLVKMTP